MRVCLVVPALLALHEEPSTNIVPQNVFPPDLIHLFGDLSELTYSSFLAVNFGVADRSASFVIDQQRLPVV